MKKILSLILALSLVMSLAACGGKDTTPTTAATESTAAPTENVTEAPTDAPIDEEMGVETMDTESLEGIINAIYEKNPVEFGAGTIGLDLTDTSEEGLWSLNAFTGLENADMISEAMVSEAMIGSIAFSMVLVRVNDAADAKAVAQEMTDNIDTRKWICVEANDKLVAGYSDTVMLIMVDSNNGMTAQSFVDAFKAVCGSDLDFTI